MTLYKKSNYFSLDLQYNEYRLFDINQIYIPDIGKAFSEKSIGELALLIKKIGLVSCLHGFIQNEKVYIVDGCRRYIALRMLTVLECPYFFHDMEITGKVPVALMDPLTGNDLALTIIAANEHYGLSSTEKNRIIDSTVLTLKILENNKQFTWPSGKKAHWLSVYTGIPEHYIKDYLADLEKIKPFSK